MCRVQGRVGQVLPHAVLVVNHSHLAQVANRVVIEARAG
jgi:hypothetical protein